MWIRAEEDYGLVRPEPGETMIAVHRQTSQRLAHAPDTWDEIPVHVEMPPEAILSDIAYGYNDNMDSRGTSPLVFEDREVKMEPVVDGSMVIEGCVEISDDECSEVSSIGSVESMSEDDVPSRRVKSRKKLDRVDAARGQWFFHKKSKLLHMCCDSGEFSFLNRKFFMCGKVVSDNYQIMSEAESGYVICVLCHRRVR